MRTESTFLEDESHSNRNEDTVLIVKEVGHIWVANPDSALSPDPVTVYFSEHPSFHTCISLLRNCFGGDSKQIFISARTACEPRLTEVVDL